MDVSARFWKVSAKTFRKWIWRMIGILNEHLDMVWSLHDQLTLRSTLMIGFLNLIDWLIWS